MDAKVVEGSPDRFGYEWDRYSEIIPEYRDQLQRWLGSTPIESFAGLAVLDVGCGMGRNPYWMAEAGARRVVAVDVDPRSLAAARRNLEPFPQAEVRECSVYDLDPEVLGRFDRVTSIGVVHHLADPEAALRAMWPCVAPGGELHLWLYGKEGNRLLLPFIHALRWVGSRLSVRWTHRLARAVALAAWPAIRFLPFRTDYYRNLRRLPFRNVELIILDQMLPRIAHYWTRSDLERLTAGLDGEREIELVQGNSWHVVLRRR